MKMKSRSNKTCQKDMYTFNKIMPHTKYSWPIGYSIWETDKTTKLKIDKWTMKMMSSRSDENCKSVMKTLQSFHTPNIIDLVLIVYELLTWPGKLNLNPWSMNKVQVHKTLSKEHVDLTRIPYIYKIKLNINKWVFHTTKSHWTLKIKSGTYDWQNLRKHNKTPVHIVWSILVFTFWNI